MRGLRQMLLVHFVANAAMLAVGYYWLGVTESKALTLAWSAFLAAVGIGMVCWTYGAALVFFGAGDRALAASWKVTLRNLMPLVAAALGVVMLYWLVSLAMAYLSTPAFRIASWLTMTLRTPVRPAWVIRAFNTVAWLIRWGLLPLLWLPMATAIAARGWRGFSGCRQPG